jgi:hypothetical protein
MSNYESEYADLILPTSAVTPLKAMLRTYTNDLRIEVRTAVTAIHNAVGTRSDRLYQQRLEERGRARYDRTRSAHAELVEALAYQVLWGALYDATRQNRPPRHPTADDMDKTIRIATNKTNSFEVYSSEGYSEASITFNGRKVRWEVGENNHAVDHAHQAELAGKFFTYLDKVNWTRGTGGVGLYHSEYDDGGGPLGFSHSVTFAYGPVGEKIQAQRMGMSLATYRARFRTTTTTRRSFTVAYR